MNKSISALPRWIMPLLVVVIWAAKDSECCGAAEIPNPAVQTMRALHEAVIDGDRTAFLARCHVPTESDLKVAKMLYEAWKTGRDLQNAVLKRYGEAGFRELEAETTNRDGVKLQVFFPPYLIESWDHLLEKTVVLGDKVTWYDRSNLLNRRILRVEGVWKLDPAHDIMFVDGHCALQDKINTACRQAIKEIAEEEKSVKEVRKKLISSVFLFDAD